DELANVEGSLMSMNLDFTEPNAILEEIQNKTNELKTDFNETRKFTQLEDLVISLKALFKDISGQSSTRDNVLTSISSLKEDISANNQRIQDVKDSTDSIITKIEAIEVTDVDSIVSPIKTVTKPISREKTHINYLFPTLIMMIVMFVSLLLSSITVIREKISSAYFRNFISPTNSGIFVLATYLTNILIITVQLIVVFGVMMAINPSLASTLSNVSLAILLITTVFILLGMIVGYVFTSEETATVGAISLGTVLLFFSNTIIPLETLPTTIKNIANFNIFVIGESILRKLILFESSLKAISKEISILLAYMFIFIAIIAIVYRASAQFYNIKRHLRGK
ncbi:MAG: ABC transporter permease, partial [Nanoarchaeota archaeon]|nr:ABC transporter permease [Nanoarchaeota archaeon]